MSAVPHLYWRWVVHFRTALLLGPEVVWIFLSPETGLRNSSCGHVRFRRTERMVFEGARLKGVHGLQWWHGVREGPGMGWLRSAQNAWQDRNLHVEVSLSAPMIHNTCPRRVRNQRSLHEMYSMTVIILCSLLIPHNLKHIISSIAIWVCTIHRGWWFSKFSVALPFACINLILLYYWNSLGEFAEWKPCCTYKWGLLFRLLLFCSALFSWRGTRFCIFMVKLYVFDTIITGQEEQVWACESSRLKCWLREPALKSRPSESVSVGHTSLDSHIIRCQKETSYNLKHKRTDEHRGRIYAVGPFSIPPYTASLQASRILLLIVADNTYEGSQSTYCALCFGCLWGLLTLLGNRFICKWWLVIKWPLPICCLKER